ncbi:hypothetical protein WS48_29900 [Burkholderia sp. RF7-non_BP1]|nr:hypothetical protein WS48_29900 [Burkholderia sp. RF7-non_BP1]KUY92001.1 hypothetical protein WS49_27615 [Burkholderia sp. RF7-non_BP4]
MNRSARACWQRAIRVGKSGRSGKKSRRSGSDRARAGRGGARRAPRGGADGRAGSGGEGARTGPVTARRGVVPLRAACARSDGGQCASC